MTAGKIMCSGSDSVLRPRMLTLAALVTPKVLVLDLIKELMLRPLGQRKLQPVAGEGSHAAALDEFDENTRLSCRREPQRNRWKLLRDLSWLGGWRASAACCPPQQALPGEVEAA